MKKTNALYRKKSDIDNCSNKSASKQKITMTFSSVANRIKSLFKLLTSRPVYRTSGQRTSDPINYVEIKTPTGFRRIEQDVLDGSKYRVVEQNDQVKTTTYYERNCSTFRIVEKEGFKQETTFVIDRDEQGRRIAVIKRDVIQRVGEPTRYREFHPDGRLKKT